MPVTEKKEISKGKHPDIASVPLLQEDQSEIRALYEQLRTANAKLVGPDGRTDLLPNNVYSFLHRLLADLRAGNSVTILQSNANLTTVEASKLLGMSRQHLVQLLKKDEVPFHMVGTHRRLYARDVLAYKVKRDIERHKALNDLARKEHEEGLYYRVPDDTDTGQ